MICFKTKLLFKTHLTENENMLHISKEYFRHSKQPNRICVPKNQTVKDTEKKTFSLEFLSFLAPVFLKNAIKEFNLKSSNFYSNETTFTKR